MMLKNLLAFGILDIQKIARKPAFLLAPGVFFGLCVAIYHFLNHALPTPGFLWILVFLSLGVHQIFSLETLPLDFIKIHKPQALLWMMLLRLSVAGSLQFGIFYIFFQSLAMDCPAYVLAAFIFSGLGLQLFYEALSRQGVQSHFISYVILMPLYLPLLIFVLKAQSTPMPLAALTVFILICAFSFFNFMMKRP